MCSPCLTECVICQKTREGTMQQEGLTIEALRGRHTCSIEDAAAALGVGRSTAYAAAREGSLPTLRLGRRLLVPTAKLLAMLGVEPEREE